MNPYYDTNLKVKDMQEPQFQLVQCASDIMQFNEEYQEDYSYYFIEWDEDTAIKLYGCNRLYLHFDVHFVDYI